MDIIDKLDFDTLGIIYEYLKDNIDFIYYIIKSEYKPFHRRINLNNCNVVWRRVSMRENMSNDFIDTFKDYLNWNIITEDRKNDMNFIRKFPDKCDWYVLSNKMNFEKDKFDYNFYEEFRLKFHWEKISRYDYIAEDFIDLFSNDLDWNVLSSCQGLTPFLMGKYRDRIEWDEIKRNRTVDQNLVKHYDPNNIEYDTDEDVEMRLRQNNEVIIEIDTDEDI